MNASVADDMLRNYFERWQRLEEEKRTVSDDLKELFSEAKGHGFDTKAMRSVFREQVGDRNAIQEFDAICDLYRTSLNGPRAGRAREGQPEVKGKSVAGIPTSETEPHDPETGGLTDTQEQPETATQSVQPDEAVAYEYAGTSSDESPASISPSPAIAPSPAGEADDAPQPSSAPSFDNPRCQQPDTCPNAHKRDTCHDCAMAWSKRPREDQIRLWQEAERAVA